MKLAFLPEPKKVKISAGSFRLPKVKSIGISTWELSGQAAQAQFLLGPSSIEVSLTNNEDTLNLSFDKSLKAEGYRLEITAKGIRIKGNGVAGVRYGLHTLAQIIDQADQNLPILSIEDWPDFEVRAIYYDVCRGRVPKLERLLELAQEMSLYKLNQLQLYVEHTFKFRSHPLIGQGADPLTADDIMILDERCREIGIELVPSLASFGHMATLLQHKQYNHLCEDFGNGTLVDPATGKLTKGYGKQNFAWSLAPANPKCYDFIEELFAEYLPCFSSDKFNVCCDETWDLGKGQSYQLAKKIGLGKMYLNHIIKLNDIAKKFGKRIQFWGDIIRHYPELIKDIPRDVTVLDWGYGPFENFDRIKDFTKTKLESYACPSVCGYVSLFPRQTDARANIAGWAKAGVKHGIKGILNTDWGDGGHYNFMEYSWPGFLFGAEQSWNHRADQKSFDSRFSKLFLGIENKQFLNAFADLCDVTHLNCANFYQSAWQHIFFCKPGDAILKQKNVKLTTSKNGVISSKNGDLNAAVGREALAKLGKARKVLAAQAKRKDCDPLGVLPYWLFATDTIIHAARKLTVMGLGGKDSLAARKALKAEMSALKKRFMTLWMERNQRSEIDITLKRYDEAIKHMLKAGAPSDPWTGPQCDNWNISKLIKRPAKGIEAARLPESNDLGWKKYTGVFACAHELHGEADGMVYISTKAVADVDDKWTAVIGHDGGAKMWLDGKEIYCQPRRENPASANRASVNVMLTKGEHDVIIALDLDHGMGWGAFFRFDIPQNARTAARKNRFLKMR